MTYVRDRLPGIVCGLESVPLDSVSAIEEAHAMQFLDEMPLGVTSDHGDERLRHVEARVAKEFQARAMNVLFVRCDEVTNDVYPFVEDSDDASGPAPAR